MRRGLKKLEADLTAAVGADTELDARIHKAIYGAPSDDVPPYTASVDACLTVMHGQLPGWNWHIGFGPRGLFPYAVLSKGLEDANARSEMTAPTVPLALLGAIIRALQFQ